MVRSVDTASFHFTLITLCEEASCRVEAEKDIPFEFFKLRLTNDYLCDWFAEAYLPRHTIFA